MGGEWRTARIEEIADKVACGPFGSSIKVSTFVEKGVPVISGQHLHGTRLEDGEYNYITLEHADKLSNANVYPGDVVFTHAGNIGQAAFIPEDSKHKRYVLSQRQFYLRPDRRKALPEFIVYFFHSPEGRHKLLANASQTGVPSIARPVSYLKSIEIPIPPLPEQRAIAHILGSLDDKIELNRRMNRTLEAMARAIFKSWFVDFDPVWEKIKRKGAKAQGRKDKDSSASSRPGVPALPSHILDLFPASFEDSELGEIPKGWVVRKLSEISKKPQYGYTASANTEVVGPKFLRIKDINKFDWIDWATVPYCEIEEKNFEKYSLHAGDIVIARIADPGHAALIEEPVDAVFASYLIRFRPLNEVYDKYLQYWFRSDKYWNLVHGHEAGSTRASLNAKVLGALPVLVPDVKVAASFKEYIQPIRDEILSNIRESNALASLRDTLLPKLISGELRVPDAEKFIEEAGV